MLRGRQVLMGGVRLTQQTRSDLELVVSVRETPFDNAEEFT